MKQFSVQSFRLRRAFGGQARFKVQGWLTAAIIAFTLQAQRSTFNGALLAILVVSSFILHPSAFAQGPLTPPGPPAPTFKTLQQVEPRTAITNLPVTISQPGSYYVTTNLTGVAGQDGITVSASDVAIDLSGFVLFGGAGSLIGIHDAGFLRTNVNVRNGTVRGWGQHGINLSSCLSGRFENLGLLKNGSSGLQVGQGSIVEGCISRNNTQEGITAVGQKGVVIRGCAAIGNGSFGIYVYDNGIVSECTAVANGSDGILLRVGSVVKDCVAQGNTGDGIEANRDCLITGNSSHGNGVGVSDGAGIHTTLTDNRIEGNKVGQNDSGIKVDAFRNLVVRNQAANNPVTPGASNYVWGAGGAIFGPTNNLYEVATGLITNQNPWANFSH